MSIPEQINKIKEYGPFAWIVSIAILSAAVSYGSASATTAATMTAHEARLTKIESASEEYGKAIARMSQQINDLWCDTRHNSDSCKR